MITSPDKHYMAPAAYLEWEPQQELRYEYVDGEAYAMTGSTILHNAIAVNLIAALRSHVRGSAFRVLALDAKIGITGQGSFFYPDVLVTCDERDRRAIQFVQFPCLIVEVLSQTTEAYDRGAKFSQYRRLASLREYVLINSDQISVEIFRLNERGKWELTPYAINDTIQLTSIDFQFPIDLLYEEVELLS
ncbi:Uma2 family endonuclease [Synechococcales cyanobacterium C]|uniref:Uma2 family endonuclease n=1 Tax=Petrachloros mirabilis ULC683 TaxID=2781853 RepID=A0A8K2A8X2_9CYAN|nr:Uma2 family endonuclease [Petrachloros mirabilis]NCJ07355.1 Uma2 family endonuclease [Petrachloros mirabilis ULC683]